MNGCKNPRNQTNRDVLNGLFSRLSLAQDETAAAAERAAGRISTGADQMAQQLESIEQKARNSTAAVQAANSEFAKESEALSLHARDAEQQVRAVHLTAAALVDQTKQMREALQGEGLKAEEAVGSLTGKLMQTGGQIRAVANGTEEALENLQNGITVQAGEMANALQTMIEKQKGVSNSLYEQRDAMGTLINRISSGQQEIASTSDRIQEQLAGGAQKIVHHLVTIGEAARAALDSVEFASSGFVQESNVLNAHALEAGTKTREMVDATATLQEQAREVRTTIESEGARAGMLLTGLLDILTMSETKIELQAKCQVQQERIEELEKQVAYLQANLTRANQLLIWLNLEGA